MPAPSGTDSQLGYAFEQAENIWVPPVNKFLRVKGYSGFVAKRGYERVSNMDSSGQTLKGIPLSALINPKIDVEPDVDAISPLLAHLCGKAPSISTLNTTAKQWLLTPREFSESAPATWQDSIFCEASDGDGKPVLVSGVRLTDFDMKIQNGKIVTCSLSFLGCFDTYESDLAEETTPGAYTGVPIIRGHRGSTFTGEMKVKVSAAAGSGYVGKVKFTHDVTAYGSTEVTIAEFDKWYRCAMSSDGSRMGVSRAEDLWICFPSTDPATVLTVNDEWSWTATRTLPTASYSTLDPLTAAGVSITIDGTEKYFHDADLKISAPKKTNLAIGSKYAVGVQKNGPVTAMVSLNRDRDDRDFLTKLIRGTSAAVVIDCYGNPIGSTGYDERLKFNMPNSQVSDAQRDVNTPNTLQEKIDLMPFRSGSTDIFDLTIVNTLSAL
jgi:hypothetical protein